jgi:hypothetical protein
MTVSPLVLADGVRAEQFHLLGRTRRLFDDLDTWTDSDGIVWAGKRVQSYSMRDVQHCFAFTWLGPGWIFDDTVPDEKKQALSEGLRVMLQADASRHQLEVNRVVKEMRLGLHAESLLWAIHAQLRASRCSLIRVSDHYLAQAVWGADDTKWPSNWHQIILSILEGLTWLHLGEGSDDAPSFGESTVILNHIADLRGDAELDQCDDGCPHRRGRRHHHILINIGKGFLGVLEQFGDADAETGVRNYHFPIGGRHAPATLQRVGKTGRLVSIFLPAKIGEPNVCQTLDGDQHRLLQAIVREGTRKTKEKRRDPNEPEIFTDGRIRSINGKKWDPCAYVSLSKAYVTFGGNGKRKGLGYLLTSEGGWLAKAGYALEEVAAFLSDLEKLTQHLDLIAIGVHRPTQHHVNLNTMQTLVATPAGRSELQELHVRFYASADFLQRWSNYFQWVAPAMNQAQASTEPLLSIIEVMTKKRITRRALAHGIGKDASFVNKILNRQKRPPRGFLEQAQAWVEGYDESSFSGPSGNGKSQLPTGHAEPPLAGEENATLLPVALTYLQRGWSVVPKKANAKSPRVRWKPFKDRNPTESQVEEWFEYWPDAGLAVVLGPVSDLFVIDVDGPEAHAALVKELGAEPTAPKAISGSRKPYRYHLFFRHPNIATKAKATPWHKKLEFRGHGGIIVVPPSRHPSGHCYSWAEGQSLDDLSLPEVPAKILDALTVVNRPAAPPSIIAPVDGLDASPSTLRFLSGEYANGPGWNDRLFRAACDLAGREIPRDVAEPLLLAGARPWNPTETENARRTIESAYSQSREPARL